MKTQKTPKFKENKAGMMRIAVNNRIQSQFISKNRQFHFNTFNSTTTRTISWRLLSNSRTSRVNSKLAIQQAGDSKETGDKETFVEDKVSVLKQKMKLLGINCNNSCMPGYFTRLLCPKCMGGKSVESSLSLHIMQEPDFAFWRCYRTSCGWAGQAFADSRDTIDGLNKVFKVKSSVEMTPEGIALEALGGKLIAYFCERMISEETLRRNSVMQIAGDQDTIAFTYRQNGVFVGCKYRTMEKRFWQESGTVKWLYGLDDITEASKIIIVEGEIDKLSMEEAGLHNCVSVPGGAPQIVSDKELPPLHQDRAYPFLWNCKGYLDKASQIILATDGDSCGQALAEELARRLGKERCWLVRWPKKDESSSFKDANEVLQHLGPVALKEVIETAKPYG